MSEAQRRLHLLVVATTYPRWPGDAEPGFVHELCRRLVRRGFDVTVVCPHAAGAKRQECMDGVEVHRARYAPDRWETLVNDGGILANLRRYPWAWLLLPLMLASLASELLRRQARRGADVVHAHWLLPQGGIVLALRSLRLISAAVVATSHGADLFALGGRPFPALRRWIVGRADAVTVVSAAMRERLLAEAGAAARHVEVRPMGIDVRERFTPGKEQRIAGRLLFVGRLVEKKGVRHLIDALPRIWDVHRDARLDIAGFGPEQGALRRQVDALGLGDRVRFLGAVPQADLVLLYRRASLFVAPFVAAASGDQEGLGLVTLEALSCGCPIVASAVPAARDVLDGLPCGAVPPGDVEALASECIRMLGDETLRERQVQAARCGVLSRFDWETVADGYAALLARAARR